MFGCSLGGTVVVECLVTVWSVEGGVFGLGGDFVMVVKKSSNMRTTRIRGKMFLTTIFQKVYCVRLFSKRCVVCVCFPKGILCAFVFQKVHCARLFSKRCIVCVCFPKGVLCAFVFQKVYGVRLFSKRCIVCVCFPKSVLCAFVLQSKHLMMLLLRLIISLNLKAGQILGLNKESGNIDILD